MTRKKQDKAESTHLPLVQQFAHVRIDRLGVRTRRFLASTSRAGSLPSVGDAVLFAEIGPTYNCAELLNYLTRSYSVSASLVQFDGRTGFVCVHDRQSALVRSAEQDMLDHVAVSRDAVTQPALLGFNMSSKADAAQAQAYNHMSSGGFCVENNAVLVVECRPSVVALAISDTVEKTADVQVIGGRITGSTGRIILAGDFQDIKVAEARTLEFFQAEVTS